MEASKSIAPIVTPSDDDLKDNVSEPCPPVASLLQLFDERPIPVLPPKIVGKISFEDVDPSDQATAVVKAFHDALRGSDARALQDCFFDDQAYWKDALAFTYHLRTFYTPSVIVANLLETNKMRGLSMRWNMESAVFVAATPVLQFIDVALSFRTLSPAASCSARIVLLPVESDQGKLEWRIWILSTKLENLDVHPEDESLLQTPGRNLNGIVNIDTDVFIIGGGNAAAALAARLKTFGVESIMAERNARVGDNWAKRYDCMKFHVPTSFCDMPYMSYPEELRGLHRLSKDELANHLAQYVASFNLNVITSAIIQSTVYDRSSEKWTIELQTPAGAVAVTAKQLVQATGVSSQKPHVPTIASVEVYKGINIHSSDYKNARALVEQGVKSVLIIGSANTAFDILGDCHLASLEPTMVVRSPTYICPFEYICNDVSLGAYNFDVARGDRMFLMLPSAVEGQLARNLFRVLASQEPDRYTALREAGFPVLDSADPKQALFSNLIERAGGHYVDVGGTDIIAQGKSSVKAGVEPIAFTESGLQFSDGSSAAADAVIWCTGFADRDVRSVAAEILGGEKHTASDEKILGPREIADRLDATWGIDAEGEIRGMWKRHLRLDNYWVMGGYTQQHRWHSRTLALQIKAALEGILPPAYRETLGRD
ncbi:probable flavoprotein involved in K+ transport [Fusarium mangiferae]|uniref:Probable flavoprotein involved in K+ transport n=1 Tax=Fusarium mangiferae TaxID=192010 RepID=A0A1L7TU94_FUSMA|nr:putative flavoprotein involved in K+ transport [Fusarium mangiferae]CVL02134.1 probable flavoprotein involved in K+ transport [Fusarium mangiferae]